MMSHKTLNKFAGRIRSSLLGQVYTSGLFWGTVFRDAVKLYVILRL